VSMTSFGDCDSECMDLGDFCLFVSGVDNGDGRRRDRRGSFIYINAMTSVGVCVSLCNRNDQRKF